jgi:hypothetical protein
MADQIFSHIIRLPFSHEFPPKRHFPSIPSGDSFLHDNVKTECRALKAKNGKFTHKGSRPEEVNFCGSSSTTLRSTAGVTPEDDPNILNEESTTEAEVLLMTEDATSWLLDSGALYHVTLF